MDISKKEILKTEAKNVRLLFEAGQMDKQPGGWTGIGITFLGLMKVWRADSEKYNLPKWRYNGRADEQRMDGVCL